MKFFFSAWLFFGSFSLATSLQEVPEAFYDVTDASHERIDVFPSRTIELHKRRRGRGGGSSGGGDDDDEDDDEDSDGAAPCVESTYTLPDPRSNRFGYRSFPREGPGSDEPGVPVGGHTRNGSGAAPEWYRERNGTWVHTCDRDDDWGGDGYYFTGGLVPFPAGEKSPNGLVPSFTELPFPEAYYPRYRSSDSRSHCRDTQEEETNCLLRNSSFCYTYPYSYNYTISEGTYDRDDSEYTYENTTSVLDILCCCSEGTPCTCDDPGDASLVQAIGDVQNFSDDFDSDIMLHNTSRVCHIDINGTGTLVLNGTVDMGSTKADPSLPDIPLVTNTTPCYGAAGRTVRNVASYWALLAVTTAVMWPVL